MRNEPSILVAIPAHNEAPSIDRILPSVLEYGMPVLLIDDGSTDDTAVKASAWPVELVRNPKNVGYGRVMRDIFSWGATRGFDWVITMDCDEQHEPSFIPDFVSQIRRNDSDVVSGSRYLKQSKSDTQAPIDRSRINRAMTSAINTSLRGAFESPITDAFCGFKAYRTVAANGLHLDADGYEFPMQFWVQAAANRLRIREIPVPRLYLDLSRSFGNGLDDPEKRLAVYHATLQRELETCRARIMHLSKDRACALRARSCASAALPPSRCAR